MRVNSFVLSCWLAACSGTVLGQDWKPQRVVGLDYPAIARGTALEGIVVVKCRLDGEGKVTAAEVRLESKSNRTLESLRNAAIENAKKWRFMKTPESGTKESEALLRYQFKLSGITRSTPRQEFAFEYPDTVTIVSEIPCLDHAPCSEEELKRHRERRNSLPIP